uniref:ATP-dependent protease La (LON) domain containing protein, putative n=1 Tax=Theileria annulata TaxID=5874 RepID=A0A3B0N3W4_THEAN
MCKYKLLLDLMATIIAFNNNSQSYKILNTNSRLICPNNLIFSKHIDDMMFECAIYRDKLTFPSNSNLDSTTRYAQGKEAENLMNKAYEEVQKARAKSELIRSNLNRIKFPIVGRTTKPETKYLQKIYYILEENNRSLNENKLSDSDPEAPKIRTLIQPKNITKVFETPSVYKCVNLFPTLLSTKSPLMPGQQTSMVLDEEHKEFLVNEIRESNIFGIFLAFVSKIDKESQKPEILPNSILCEFVDITNLDNNGVITVKALDRFKIGNVIAISDAVIRAEISLLRDTDMLRNPGMAEENARIIEKLYDRCNLLESEYRKVEGNMDDAQKIDSRMKFGEKISKMIENVDFEKDPNLIYELTAFAGLEFNADTETKIWACNTTDTDQRLIVTVDVLKTKIKYLNDLIRDKTSDIETHKDAQL